MSFSLPNALAAPTPPPVPAPPEYSFVLPPVSVSVPVPVPAPTGFPAGFPAGVPAGVLGGVPGGIPAGILPPPPPTIAPGACYRLDSQQCTCDAGYCTPDLCAARRFIWTDNCPDSCSGCDPMAGPALPPPAWSFLRNEHPLTAEFRSGPRNGKGSYEKWQKQQVMPYGHPVDLQTNVLRFAPENYGYANRFAEEHPETIVLSTWRAASGMPRGAPDDGDPLGVSDVEFPGHWVVSPGSYLAADATGSATEVSVWSAGNMIVGPALMVETTGWVNGTAPQTLWDRFEYVLITGVNQTARSVGVERQFNGSPPSRAFPASRTKLLPMPWDMRNRKPYTDWFFNFDRACPRDANGDTAMDVIMRNMVGPLDRASGPLNRVAGLDLASGPLTVSPNNADYDHDGIRDPADRYREGVREFYERIRAVIGQDGILTTSLDMEFVDYINGVNREGLAKPNDPWEKVTRTVNHVLRWQRLQTKLPIIGLAFQQHHDSEELLIRIQLQRLLAGYSVCLGIAADVDTKDSPEALNELKIIELYKGDEQKRHWLGKPVGVSRPAAHTTNLLNGSNRIDRGREWATMLPSITVNRGTAFVDGDELVVRPNLSMQEKTDGRPSDNTDNSPPKIGNQRQLMMELVFDLDEKSDITIYMEAKSEDDQIFRNILPPRPSVDVDTGATRAEITSKDYIPVTFYIRGASMGKVQLNFPFDDGGDIRFRSLSVHKAADTFACEFEKGVVLVNPSLEDISFDLEQIFPARSGFQRLLASPPKGSGDIPDELQPQLKQAMEMNNGDLIENPTSVQLSQRNALFLIADAISVADGSQPDTDIYGEAPAPETAPTQVVVSEKEVIAIENNDNAEEKPQEATSVNGAVNEEVIELCDDDEFYELFDETYLFDDALFDENYLFEFEVTPNEDGTGHTAVAVAGAIGDEQNDELLLKAKTSTSNRLVIGVGFMAALSAVALGAGTFLIRKANARKEAMSEEKDFGEDTFSPEGEFPRDDNDWAKAWTTFIVGDETVETGTAA